ncbi:MAG: hypothetical protein RBQ64_02945 [Candidatus Izemoplasmatales bacterium]|jgi:hypothetical protein|nr:hypothetical protein [Candidatus Izemoplasmatales bacterium]
MKTVKIKVAEIVIEYTYNFDDYFKSNIEQYEVLLEEAKYRINCEIVNDIEDVDIDGLTKIDNRDYYLSPVLEVVKVYHPGTRVLSQLVYFDKLRKTCEIKLNRLSVKDLAMQEYVLSGVIFMEIALMEGFLPLHASAISFDDEAILFAGRSTVGKSTQSTMWRFYFKDRVSLINDDKPLIFVKSGMLFVSGSPFSGKDSLSRNITRRLRAIVFLEEENAPFIEHLDNKTKVELIFRNTINIGHTETIDNIVSIITKIVEETDIIRFYATKGYESVEYLEKYLKGELEDETVS